MKDCQSIHITEIGESCPDILTIPRAKLIWYDKYLCFKINHSKNKFSSNFSRIFRENEPYGSHRPALVFDTSLNVRFSVLFFDNRTPRNYANFLKFSKKERKIDEKKERKTERIKERDQQFYLLIVCIRFGKMIGSGYFIWCIILHPLYTIVPVSKGV
jgi:hypothetical protein